MRIFVLFLILLILPPLGEPPRASTRVLANAPGQNVIVGFNYDTLGAWPLDVFVFPKGINHDGSKSPAAAEWHDIFPPSQFEGWKSTYRSAVAVGRQCLIVAGINEKGLGVHFLDSAWDNVSMPSSKKKVLSDSSLLQFFLDQAKTVPEAIRLFDSVEVVGTITWSESVDTFSPAPVAIEDTTGDSAIFEYSQNRWHVYHGPEYQLMTSQLPYDEQIATLKDAARHPDKSYLFPKKRLSPHDRLRRAAYYLSKSQKPGDGAQEMSTMIDILRKINASTELGDNHGADLRNQFRLVLNLSRLVFYIESTDNRESYTLNLTDYFFESNADPRPISLRSMLAHPHSKDSTLSRNTPVQQSGYCFRERRLGAND